MSVTYQSEDVGDGPAAEYVSEASCGDEDSQEKVDDEEDGQHVLVVAAAGCSVRGWLR